MAPKPVIVRPFLEGWGVQDRGEWRGPYFSQEIAVQVAMAELNRRHALTPELRMLVVGADGTVLLEWPDTRSADDLIMVEASPWLPSESAGAPKSDGGLRDWRDDPRRYYR